MLTNNEVLTPRESIIMEAEKEEAKLAREHEITMKRLELQAMHEQASLRRIPVLVLRVLIVPFVGIAYIVTRIRGQEVEPGFWELLR